LQPKCSPWPGNEATDTFIIGDEGTWYITQLFKTGAVIDTMNLLVGLFDPEGLTAIGNNNQFVVANERERGSATC
jgi:uncharacterized protein YjiK